MNGLSIRQLMELRQKIIEGPVPVEPEEYRDRQSRFVAEISERSLAIFPTNPTRIRSRDVEYIHRPSSDLVYLCGWTESEGILAALVDDQGGATWHLFVAPQDIAKEIWTGRRTGPKEAQRTHPIDTAHPLDKWDEWVKEAILNSSQVYHVLGIHPSLDNLIHSAMAEETRERQRLDTGPRQLVDPRNIISELRLKKSESEIAIMRYAGEITALAHIEAMRQSHSGIGEWQLEAIIEGHFRYLGADGWAYPSIVGGGDRATILHYQKNNQIIEAGEMVLIDAGCEVNCYASDITRTWPIDGTFSDRARDLYSLVLEAQEQAIDACVIGAPYTRPHEVASDVLREGLIQLGLITSDDEEESQRQLKRFFMHNTSHWLGLDVHDVGTYQPEEEPRLLEEGMVLTIEPGLYIAGWRSDLSDVDDAWKGLGIRIEDDIHVTSGGPDILSNDCPKTIDEIEAIVGSG